MTARSLILVVTSILLLATSVSFARAEKPTAPPPRLKTVLEKQKASAELLVGKWKQIEKRNSAPLPSGVEVTFDFSPDNKVVIRVTGTERAHPYQVGTYRLKDNILRMTIEKGADPDTRDRVLMVDSITHEKLILSYPQDDNRKPIILIYARIKQ